MTRTLPRDSVDARGVLEPVARVVAGGSARILDGEAAMRAVTSDGVERWTRGLGLAALVVLAWSALAPDGPFWTAVLAALLVSSVLAAAFLVRSRPGPWRR